MAEWARSEKKSLIGIDVTMDAQEHKSDRVTILARDARACNHTKNIEKEELFKLREEFHKAQKDIEKLKTEYDAIFAGVAELKKSIDAKNSVIQQLNSIIDNLKFDLAVAKRANEKLMERIIDTSKI